MIDSYRNPWNSEFIFSAAGVPGFTDKRYQTVSEDDPEGMMKVLMHSQGWNFPPEEGLDMGDLLRGRFSKGYPRNYIVKEIYEDESNAYVTFVHSVQMGEFIKVDKQTYEVELYQPGEEHIALYETPEQYFVLAAMPVDSSQWSELSCFSQPIRFGRDEQVNLRAAVNFDYDYTSLIHEEPELVEQMSEVAQRYGNELFAKKQELWVKSHGEVALWNSKRCESSQIGNQLADSAGPMAILVRDYMVDKYGKKPLTLYKSL